MRGYRFYIVTVCVVFILFSFVTMKVKGQEEPAFAGDRVFYGQLEDSYRERLQESLEEKGYRNAGITMTKVYQTDGSREYTVQIHHKRIRKMDAGERMLLQSELEAISFGNESCHVQYHFLDCEN